MFVKLSQQVQGSSLESNGAKLAKAVAHADRTSPAESEARGKMRRMTPFLKRNLLQLKARFGL